MSNQIKQRGYRIDTRAVVLCGVLAMLLWLSMACFSWCGARHLLLVKMDMLCGYRKDLFQMDNYKEFENTEMELDEIVEIIGEQILQDEKIPGILNLTRVQQMQFSYAVLKKLCKDEGMTVRYIQNEPFQSMGSIFVEGDSLEFGDCKWLGKALEFADNVEIYPILNERVRMTLTFHKLTVPIKSEDNI